MASLCLGKQHLIYAEMDQIAVGSKCAQLSQIKGSGAFLVISLKNRELGKDFKVCFLENN